MKILGEELGDLGRWYLVLPPLLLIGFLVGLFLLATAGQSRLNAANERAHDLQLRQQALSEFMALLTDAESGQRGFLLTGESSYLQPYTDAVVNVQAALDRVREFRGDDGQDAEINELKLLTELQINELKHTLTLFKRGGAAPAMSLVRTDVGRRTMEQISKIVARLRLQEAQEFSSASALWQHDFRLSRWVTALGALLNIGLVMVATRLVYKDMRRRARQAIDLREQKHELERQVEARTRELTALSTHLQEVSEQEKYALSRELHDELGGLLVAARMDLSWLQQRLSVTEPAIEQRFQRIHDSLSAGVDLKRRVVEELRPTLLDNMGLYAALRWQFKETCRRTGLKCTESIPESELEFNPHAAIGVFRFVQEALTNILKHANAKSAAMMVGIRGTSLVLSIADDGKGIAADRISTITSHGLASMRHRITALGGAWQVGRGAAGGTVVTAVIPLDNMILKETA